MMKSMSVCWLFVVLVFCFFFSSSKCTSYVSKCNFFDKRNKEVKQVFYIPSRDIKMYRETINKMLSREFSALDESFSEEIKDEEEEEEKKKSETITNMEDIKNKEKKEKQKKQKIEEIKEKLAYIEKYRKHVKNILKNIEFKCEQVKDYETKIKCNLCIYTEIVNNKHIRQGQIIQIFMNECMYGFYYYDNIHQYYGDKNNDSVKRLSDIDNSCSVDSDTDQKIDDIYMDITKDVVEGNTSQINFFRRKNSGYHPVCYVSE